MKYEKEYCRQTGCPIHKNCSLYVSDNKYRKLRKEENLSANFMLPNPNKKSDCSYFVPRKGK